MNTGKANSKRAHCYTYSNLVPSSLDYSRIKIIAILKKISKRFGEYYIKFKSFSVRKYM